MIVPTRRAFLRMLLASPLALTVDVEQLLWTPSPMVVVPSWSSPLIEELNQITLAQIYPSIVEDFFKRTPLLRFYERNLAHALDRY